MNYINILNTNTKEIIILIDDLFNILEISDNIFQLTGYEKSQLIEGSIADLTNMLNIEELPFNNLNIIKLKTVKDKYKYFNYFINYDVTHKLMTLSLTHIHNFNLLFDEYLALKHICENCDDIIYREEFIPKPKFTYINDGITKVLGYTKEEIYNSPYITLDIIHPEDRHLLIHRLNASSFKEKLQIRYKHKCGKYIWLEDFSIPTYNENGELIAVQGISRCIQKSKQLETKLKLMSYSDSLTGLGNRAYLNNIIEKLKSSKNSIESLGFIILDLDNLKTINDTLGHLLGDKLIMDSAFIIKNTFFDSYANIRLGGDEFLIVYKNINSARIKTKLNLLSTNISNHNSKTNIKISISYGFSIQRNMASDITKYITLADERMYVHKQSKKL